MPSNPIISGNLTPDSSAQNPDNYIGIIAKYKDQASQLRNEISELEKSRQELIDGNHEKISSTTALLNVKLNEAVDRLLELRDERDDLREQLDGLNAMYEAQGEAVLNMDWPETTLKYEDVTISRVNTKSVKIIDPKAVITWLKRNKIPYLDFMRLDTVKVKPVLSTAIFTQGKTVSGTEHETKVSLRISDK